MAVRRLAEKQPESFAFTPENKKWAEAQLKKFPEGRQASAVIPLLWRAQEQHDGWLPEPAIRHVGEVLDMSYIRVLEIATFYSMFNLEPVGVYFVQLCGTTPCRLRGAEEIIKVCQLEIGPQRQVTEDGKFSWLEVECLGACCNAPMVQINKDYYEDLTPELFKTLLDDLRAGRPVKPGPQNGRQMSAPAGSPTTLTDPALYNNRRTLVSETDGAVSRSGAGDAPSGRVDTNAGNEEKAASGANKASKSSKSTSETVDKPTAPADRDADADTGQNKAAMLVSDDRPGALDEPAGGVADDLKRISGIGPKIEGILNGLGIFHFAQIAQWNAANKAWVDGYLSFKGRIDRENWVGQAAKLAEGGETPFSKRVDKGDVPSSQG